MRVLALDIGEKRIGVAVSDPSGRVATPVTILDAAAALGDSRAIRRLVDDYEAASVLIGLPLSLDGTEGPQARRVREVGERIAESVDVPVEYADERLSSAQASRAMAEAGLTERQRRGKLDAAAAAIFLQGWLDARVGEELT